MDEPAARSHFAPGDVVADRYKVIRFIARGGMGEVYEVEDTALATRVALKALRAHLVTDDAAAERFRREILLARQVTHPNVCRIFDLATHRAGAARLPVLTMELLGGVTLAERLRRGGALGLDEALDTLRQIVAGLTEAHRRGIIHRDLKSANVILEDTGGATRVVLTDFGLARSLSTGDSQASLVGTPAYMAPEQIAGGSVGPATDVYALGVVLFEMLSGRLAGTSPPLPAAEIRAEVARGVAGIPPAWARVIERCLAFDPAERFAAMDEVLAALGGPPPADSALLRLGAGDRLGRHRVMARLAAGPGTARALYRARDPALGRTVLLEVTIDAAAPSPPRLRRVEDELRGLAHPGLPRLLEIGLHEGAVLAVLDVAEGRSLRELVDEGPLPPARATALAARLAGALAELHGRGLVLGGLAPEQVLLTRDGAPLVLGLAGAMLRRGGAGAPAASGDLAGLGALLAWMLLGRAVEAGDAAAVGRLPPELAPIVARCLEERYQSARDLAFQLELAGGAGPKAARAPRATGWRLAGVAVAGAAAALGAAALALGGWTRAAGPETHIDYTPLTFDRGFVGNARYGGDGRTIIYSSAADGEPARVYMKLAGSRETRALSEPGFDLLGLSQGGELALRRWDGPFTILARMSVAGSAPRDIAEHVWAADWTPGGELVTLKVLPDPRRRVIELPLGTPVYTTLSVITALRASPAGDRAAFVEHPIEGDDAGRIGVVERGGAMRYVTEMYTVIRGVAWRPDGRELLFYAMEEGGRGGLYAATLSGRVRRVLALPYAASVLDAGADGVLVTLEDASLKALFYRAGAERPRNLSWLDYSLVTDLSVDGGKLVICEGAPAASDDYETFLRPTDGGPAIHLGRGYATELAPDGRWVLAFAREGKRHHLMLLPTGVGDARELPRGPITAYSQAWGGFFPDGKRVVFQAKAEAGWQLWEQAIDGQGEPRALTPEGFRLAGPAIVTPDGKRLLAVGPTGERLLLDVPAGARQPVVGLSRNLLPVRFTADGRALWVTHVEDGRLRVERLDLDSGARAAQREVELDGFVNGPMAMTPDGESLAFTVERVHQTLFAISGPGLR